MYIYIFFLRCPASYSMGTGGFFFWDKAAGAWIRLLTSI